MYRVFCYDLSLDVLARAIRDTMYHKTAYLATKLHQNVITAKHFANYCMKREQNVSQGGTQL